VDAGVGLVVEFGRWVCLPFYLSTSLFVLKLQADDAMFVIGQYQYFFLYQEVN
jgi:hypothetical protein